VYLTSLVSPHLTLQEEDRDEHSDAFTNRDLVITHETIVAVEMLPASSSYAANTVSLSFYVKQEKAWFSRDDLGDRKTWKIVFDNSDDRDRFFRLMQIHLLSKSERADASTLTTPTPDGTPNATRKLCVRCDR